MQLNLNLASISPRLRDKIISSITKDCAHSGYELAEDLLHYHGYAVQKEMEEWKNAAWELHHQICTFKKENL